MCAVPTAPEEAGRPSRGFMLRWPDPPPGRPRLCGLRSAQAELERFLSTYYNAPAAAMVKRCA